MGPDDSYTTTTQGPPVSPLEQQKRMVTSAVWWLHRWQRGVIDEIMFQVRCEFTDKQMECFKGMTPDESEPSVIRRILDAIAMS